MHEKGINILNYNPGKKLYERTFLFKLKVSL